MFFLHSKTSSMVTLCTFYGQGLIFYLKSRQRTSKKRTDCSRQPEHRIRSARGFSPTDQRTLRRLLTFLNLSLAQRLTAEGFRLSWQPLGHRTIKFHVDNRIRKDRRQLGLPVVWIASVGKHKPSTPKEVSSEVEHVTTTDSVSS